MPAPFNARNKILSFGKSLLCYSRLFLLLQSHCFASSRLIPSPEELIKDLDDCASICLAPALPNVFGGLLSNGSITVRPWASRHVRAGRACLCGPVRDDCGSSKGNT